VRPGLAETGQAPLYIGLMSLLVENLRLLTYEIINSL
jgi:hypothetical protein